MEENDWRMAGKLFLTTTSFLLKVTNDDANEAHSHPNTVNANKDCNFMHALHFMLSLSPARTGGVLLR
jgi:hypothetical protein